MKRLTSSNIPQAIGSYSAASLVGNIIYTSGQLPINPATQKIDDIACVSSQTRQVMENIKHLLNDNNSSMDNIIKTTVFLNDIKDFAKFNEVYSQYFANEYPSRSCFEVGALPMGALVEIEVIAKVCDE